MDIKDDDSLTDHVPQHAQASAQICPLCQRSIPTGARQSVHHLVPKLKGGRGGPTVLLHQICHNEIHAAYTEAELARDFYTVEKLQASDRLAPFLKWIRKKPPEFDARSRPSVRRRRKR